MEEYIYLHISPVKTFTFYICTCSHEYQATLFWINEWPQHETNMKWFGKKSFVYRLLNTYTIYIHTHIHFLGTESLIKLTWIFWIDPPVNEMQRLFVMSHYKLALQKWIIQACQKLIWIFSRSCDCRKKLKSFKNHNIFYLKIYLYANMFYCEQRL